MLGYHACKYSNESFTAVKRGGAEAPLGRVFVQDPDDGDVADKTFRWVGSPHPLFTLDPQTGDLLASSHIREGK